MKTRALMPLVAMAALAASEPAQPSFSRVLARRRKKESIDDVLARARASRGKGWYDPKVDGTVRG